MTNYSSFLCCVGQFNWNSLTPIIALLVSIIALLVNRRIAQRNTRLTIQLALFKTVTDKVKDCNMLWENEPADERHENATHFKVMSELIISIEVIEKSLFLFEKNYKSIRNESENDCYYLFWKQLRTDLRAWIKSTPRISETIDNSYYNLQIATLFEKFQPYFEKIL